MIGNEAERLQITQELAEARQDLRETVAELAQRVERTEQRLSPRRMIERHPVVAACGALTLGFALAGGDAELSLIFALCSLFGAVMKTADREQRADDL